MAEAIPNRNLVRTDKRFMQNNWNKLGDFFSNKKYIDVTFVWKNKETRIGAHRIILASASVYFDELFQTDQGAATEIYIENIEPETFSQLIKYCYSGTLCPNKETVHNLLSAAAILKLDEAVGICVDFLKGPKDVPRPLRTSRVNPSITGKARNTIQATVPQTPNPRPPHSILAIQKCDGQKDNECRVYRSDQFDKRWLQYGIITCAKKFSDLAYFEKNLFFVGGCLADGEPTNKMDAYNLETHTWKELTPMKSHRGEVCVATVNGILYAIGGYGRDQEYPLKTAEKYDLHSGKWSSIPDMSVARRNATCVAVGDLIYVIGGFGADWELLRSVECFNVKTSSWSKCADMKSKRFNCGASTLNGVIYVIGSGNVPPYSRDVECYIPQTNTWTQVAPLEVARHGVSGVTLNGQLLAVGGSLPNYYKGFVDVYNPVQNIWTKAVPLPSGGNYKCFVVPTDELVKMECTRKRSISLNRA